LPNVTHDPNESTLSFTPESPMRRYCISIIRPSFALAP
jgi:hypothetical protein